MRTLRLTTPAPSKRIDQSIVTKPKAFKDWLDYLPYATPANALEKLIKGVSTHNRQQISTAHRFEMLEMVQQPFAVLLDAYLQPRPDRGTLPINKRNRQIGSALHKLSTEIAFGYKLVIKQSLGSSIKLGRHKILHPSLQRAMKYLGMTLLQSFIDYTPGPNNVWREIYQIYAYAEEAKIHDQTISDQNDRFNTVTTIQRLFKQIILLSLVDPYRLPDGQTWLLFNYLNSLEESCKITPFGETNNNLGFFVVDLNSDLMPQPLTDEQLLLDAPQLIDTRTLVARVNQERELAQKGNVPANFPLPTELPINDKIQLLIRLQKGWTSKQSRKMPRVEEVGRAQVLCGLDAVHHHLATDHPKSENQEQHNDQIEITSQLGDRLKNGTQDHALNQWRLINRSLGGLSLAANAASNCNLTTGQLLAIHSNDKESDEWIIAISRWLIYDANQNENKFGIQYLSKKPQAVQIKAQVGSQLEMEWRPAITFELRTKSGIQQCIVCAKGFHLSEREFQLVENGSSKTINCGQLVETTSLIDWFIYTD